MLRKFRFIPCFCLSAVASLFFVSIAQAQTSPLYFAGYLGLSTYSSLDFTQSTIPTRGAIKPDNGANFAAALGLRLNPSLRMELEYSQTKPKITAANIGGAADFAMDGSVKTQSTLLNLYYDVNPRHWSLTPFVTAGIGMHQHNVEIDDISGNLTDTTDSARQIGYQVGAGFKQRISPDLAFTAGYRYLGGVGALNVGDYDLDFHAHQWRLGMEYDLKYLWF